MPDYVERPIMTLDADEAKDLLSRLPEIERAVTAVERIDAGARPTASVLLQRDLWSAFDAIHGQADATLTPLLDRLGRAIAHLALPAERLAELGPTLSDVAADPLVARGEGGDLVEVVADESEPPSAPPAALTTHARIRASRSVFRRYVRVPGGASAAQALFEGSPATVKLPEGTLALIVETPLALSAAGEPVPLRLVTLAEMRRVGSRASPKDGGAPRVADVGFDVLEGRRAILRSAAPRLEALAPGAPFPSTGSCGHEADVLVPMRKSCVLCHGVQGDELRIFSHGEGHFRLAGPLDAVEEVLRSKVKRADFAALRGYFGR
jgi:hypothetical protein